MLSSDPLTPGFAPLQTATGGSPTVVALTLAGLLVTAGLALAVAYLLVRGYRRNRDPARLYLAVGLVLLTTGPIALQLVLTNATDVSPVGRAAAANASKLLGLAAVLYAIYGAANRTVSVEVDGEIDLSEPGRDRR